MDAYRSQEKFDVRVTTIVSNNSNFMKGRPDEPVLISWDDATTLFHEFGHAVHGLASDVNYPSLSGTAVPMPSATATVLPPAATSPPPA